MLEGIEPETLEEPTLRFLEGLGPAAGTTFVSLRGRKVYLVVKPEFESVPLDQPFTDEARERRYVLIDKRIDGTISPDEAVELAELDVWLDRHLQRVAPLPIEYARQLERELLDKTRTPAPRR
jgi:hypothetical protein